MSTDPTAAMGRIDAAVQESLGRSAVPANELADLAAAIERIESLIVEGAGQGAGGLAAEGRIANIAFGVHDREVETSLGDELNAAVREINDIGGLKQMSPERAQHAAELLRQLSRRVHDMIEQSKADQRSGPARKQAKFVIADDDDEEDGDGPNEGSFKTDVPEDDEFALVVAALTAALPSLAEFGAPVPVPPAALTRDAALLTDDALLPEMSIEPGDEAKTAESEPPSPPAETSGETVMVIESSSTVLLDDSVLPPTSSNKEKTSSEDFSAGEPPDGALTDTLLEDLLRATAPSENPIIDPPTEVVTEPSPESEVPAEDTAPEAVLALPLPQAPDESAHEAIAAVLSADLAEQLADHGDARKDVAQTSREAEEQQAADVDFPVVAESAAPSNKEPSSPSLLPLLSPDEDPGDLFDEIPPAPNIVASTPERVVVPTETALESVQAIESPLATPMPLDPKPLTPASPSPQSRVVAATVPQQPVPRPASNDPLGPIRALSEEETIALFS
jgi:hypothetical protein